MLSDMGIEGVEVEDNIPLSPELIHPKCLLISYRSSRPDEGVGYVSFYLDSEEDHTEKLNQVREGLEELRLFVEVGKGTISREPDRRCGLDEQLEGIFPFLYDR